MWKKLLGLLSVALVVTARGMDPAACHTGLRGEITTNPADAGVGTVHYSWMGGDGSGEDAWSDRADWGTPGTFGFLGVICGWDEVDNPEDCDLSGAPGCLDPELECGDVLHVKGSYDNTTGQDKWSDVHCETQKDAADPAEQGTISIRP